jgi:hypothetical protein
MDWHDYITGELIQSQLAERRAAAAIQRIGRAHRVPRRPVRAVVGAALIRLGSRLTGPVRLAVHDSGH